MSLEGIDLTNASVWEQGTPHDWLDRLGPRTPSIGTRRPTGLASGR
jgi:hypothetical protein